MLEKNVSSAFIHSIYIQCQAPGATRLDYDTFTGLTSSRHPEQRWRWVWRGRGVLTWARAR